MTLLMFLLTIEEVLWGEQKVHQKKVLIFGKYLINILIIHLLINGSFEYAPANV